MKIHYLEIVSTDVEATCAAYEVGLGAQFSSPEESLGGARTAELNDGSMVGVRKPLHESEVPVVRPYWLVADIEIALAEITAQGAEVAHPPLEISGKGMFAIYIQGGVQLGLWQI